MEVINVQKYSYLNHNPKHPVFLNSSHEHINNVPFSPTSNFEGSRDRVTPRAAAPLPSSHSHWGLSRWSWQAQQGSKGTVIYGRVGEKAPPVSCYTVLNGRQGVHEAKAFIERAVLEFGHIILFP